MADDFPDLLRLGCNSNILFMGNFPMTTQYVPLFLSYMNVSLLLLLFCKTPGPGSYLLISLELLSPILTPPPTGLQQFLSKGSHCPAGEVYITETAFITETAHLLDLLLLSAILVILLIRLWMMEGGIAFSKWKLLRVFRIQKERVYKHTHTHAL